MKLGTQCLWICGEVDGEVEKDSQNQVCEYERCRFLQEFLFDCTLFVTEHPSAKGQYLKFAMKRIKHGLNPVQMVILNAITNSAMPLYIPTSHQDFLISEETIFH